MQSDRIAQMKSFSNAHLKHGASKSYGPGFFGKTLEEKHGNRLVWQKFSGRILQGSVEIAACFGNEGRYGCVSL